MISVSQPSITELEINAVDQVMRSGWVTQGKKVREFEAQLSNLLRVPYAFACSSGTAALHLALLGVGVGEGDEVLVPDLTYVATANAVRYVGATPILVDVDPDTWLIDLKQAERKISSRTRAILPVHLYGIPCDLSAIAALASEHKLKVVEDAAEALSGRWRDVPCGAGGDAGIFSFYGNKVITTGEGGAVVCWDHDVAKKVFSLRGQAVSPGVRYYHTEVGYNYRMTDIQAAMGVAQLSRLPSMLADRFGVYRSYTQALSKYFDSIGSCPSAYNWQDRWITPWLYTFQHGKTRDALTWQLLHRGVETRPVFVPLHRLPMYEGLDRDFPVSSRLSEEGISLPTYPGVRVDEVLDSLECSLRSLH